MSEALVLGAALTCTAAGQLCYKLVFSRNRVFLAPALLLFVAAQVCFFLSLRVLPLGVVYMSTGFTHALVLGLSRVVLLVYLKSMLGTTSFWLGLCGTTPGAGSLLACCSESPFCVSRSPTLSGSPVT